MTPRQNNTRDERGVAMLYAAVFLLTSVWLVSLALDMGKLMTTKTELQRAADAAALAGASAVDSDTGILIEDVARTRAASASKANEALQETAEPVVIDPETDVTFPQANQVQVTVHRSAATGNPMTTIFARALGIMSIDVHASATAEVAPIKPCDGIPPFAVVDQPGGYGTGCPQQPSDEYSLNLDPGTSVQAVSAGGPTGKSIDTYIIDFSLGGEDCNEGPCAGQGGNPLGCYILNGYGCCLKDGDQFQTIPFSDQFSTVKNSLSDRWDKDTDSREGICYSEYVGNGSRVLICPIVQVLGGGSGDADGDGDGRVTHGAGHGRMQATQTGGGGPFTVKIVGFTSFFIMYKPQPTELLRGQVFNYVAPGDPANTDTQNKIYGTRLVLDPP